MRCIAGDDKLAEYWITDEKVTLPLCGGCAVNAEAQGYEVKTMKGSIPYETGKVE